MFELVEPISICVELWGVGCYPGGDALVKCATDAAAMTIEGIPWTVRKLCQRHATAFGGTVDSVELSMARALANADVHHSVRSAICVLVGHALRDMLGSKWRNGD